MHDVTLFVATREITFYASCHIICHRSFTNDTLHTVQSLSVSLYNHPTTLLLEILIDDGNIDWLIDWCLMPTLAVCQLYRGIWKYFESMPFTLMCFSSHSNAMMSWQSCLAQKIMCNFIPFFYHHRCGDTTSCIRQTAFFQFQKKTYIIQDKKYYVNA